MKKAGLVLSLLAAIVAAASLLRGGGDDAVEVRFAPVVEQGLTSRVLAQGRVRARTQVEVSSEVAGRVAVVAVDVGDTVKAGDLLFSLDGEQLKSAVEQIGAALAAAEALLARADVAVKEAERALERDQRLAGQGVLAEDTLKLDESRVAGARAERAQAEANVERARVDLTRAKDALRRARVTAPQAGTVVAVGVEVGKVVTAGTGLSASPDAALGLGLGGASAPVIIADLGELIVKLDVDELDIARVRAGQRAIVRAQGIKDLAFDGVVEKVGLLGRDALGAVLFAVDVRVTGTREASAASSSSSPPGAAVPLQGRSPAVIEPGAGSGHEPRENKSGVAVAPPRERDAGIVSRDGQGEASVPVTAAATPEGRVRALPAPQELLRPGMTASAEIEVEHLERAVVIPLGAVLEATKNDDEEKPDRVFVVDGDAAAVPVPVAAPSPSAAPPSSSSSSSSSTASSTASAPANTRPVWTVREVAVRLGPADGDAIAVLEGLATGQQVVEGPYRALKDLEDGDRVRALDEEDAPAAGDGRKKRKKSSQPADRR
jgi:multidrug efflux pump subunit AcrA (membrane-fusion protein)